MKNGPLRIAPVATLLWCLMFGSAAAEVVMTSEHFENTDTAFEQCGERIAQLHGRNLLARRGVLVQSDGSFSDASLLTDGLAGSRGDEGRVFLNGTPTVIAFYLGQPKPVTEIGLFTFNVDTRANQDFEVRVADNSTHPGVKPDFGSAAVFSSGDKVIGPNAGGCYTRVADKSGGPLVPGKVDWVEFRIWRTHTIPAGEPARSGRGGASVYVELAVLGAPDDVVLPSPEERARRQRLSSLPKQPPYEKKATARETLIAGREAMLDWEAMLDRLVLPDLGVALGSWHVLGPVTRADGTVAELDKATKVDLAQRFQAAGGRELAWERRDDWNERPLLDLTGYRGARPQDIVYLCRTVTFGTQIERNRLRLPVSGSEGWVRWLPKQQTVGLRGPVAPHDRDWELEGDPGEYQILVRLAARADGQRRFWSALEPSASRPGAGPLNVRAARREGLFRRVWDDFADPLDRLRLRWEASDDFWSGRDGRRLNDWLPGESDAYLRAKYQEGISQRLAALKKALAEETGIRALVLKDRKDGIAAELQAADAALKSELDLAAFQEQYEHLHVLEEMIAVAGRVRSLRLAVQDQRDTFPDRYPRAAEFLSRVGGLEQQVEAAWQVVASSRRTAFPGRHDGPEGPSYGDALRTLLAGRDAVQAAGSEILLENPVLAFDGLLVAKGGPGFNSNWGGPNTLGNSIVLVSPPRPGGQETVLYQGRVSDMDLHWDARRLLFSDGRAIWEIRVDGSGLRRVSKEDPPVTHYDACYLPDGRICCVSNACEQAVPCTGGADVGNLHLMDADGGNETRVAFDQDHNWNPVVLSDGRVLYTRWEYTDTPHYFSRLLFRMNPDGTSQMEYYGSNSYWPNAMYWPRPIPGHPTMVSCIVSGHHGVSRVGEMVLLDPARGRHEADGVVQRIPGYGQRVKPVIKDQLVIDTWPRYAAPYPLAEPGTNRGAGKYFLACVQDDERSTWDVCLVDVFDNVTRILSGGYMTPIPVQPRLMPPVIPSRVDPKRNDAVVYLSDVYAGPGLEGYPRGSIKRLRIGSHHYRFAGNGDTRASSYEGGWDVKKILGTVPVAEDGSALFRVPANTPIFVQPLDAEGKCQQQMRSWYTAMPGEIASCIGCHERQNDGALRQYTAAATRRPSEIEPWHGPARGFSFDREVQPVLDRRCVGCHNGQPYRNGDRSLATIDLRAKRLHAEFQGDYSPAYMALQAFVRRAGYEADYHLQVPAEWEADTSPLVQLLKKGHHHVTLTAEDWERLYTWIDFNVPYPANWRESHRPPADEQVARRVQYKKLFARIDDRDEEPLPLPPIAPFEPPPPALPRPATAPALDPWPIPTTDAQALQQAAGPVEKELDLGDGLTMKFRLVPAGSFAMGDVQGFADECPPSVVQIGRPFYLGTFEVTNQQYARFDPTHDSAYIDGRWKDRTTRGVPLNQPAQPVVRVTWHEALAFCQWLSQRTGQQATLPTEAQWEWACRAGTSSRWSFGEYQPGMQRLANIADGSVANWNYGRQEPGYQDGLQYSAPGGTFPANAWGLCDMHGNVAEWCLTTYRPYPYRADDGRDRPGDSGMKVVRGGSWNDTLRFATSASRWRYEPYKPVYNVGFRVLLEVPGGEKIAAAGR